MIKKYIESIIDCLKAAINLYPIFLILLGLEVFYRVLGVNQYSLIGLVRFFMHNSENTNNIVLLAKLLISVSASVIAYNSVCFFIFRNLYNKIGINVRYRNFAKSLWLKHFITMAIIYIPLKLIIEIINNSTRIQGFIGYLFIFTFIIFKSTAFFYILQVISKKYISNINVVNNASNDGLTRIFGRLGVMFITVVLIASPISYYLGNLEYVISTQNSNFITVVNFVNILFKTLYNTFLVLYISIAIFQATQKEIGVRSS